MKIQATNLYNCKFSYCQQSRQNQIKNNQINLKMENKNQFFCKNSNKILQLQNHLIRHRYFSKDCLPGIADALMFQIFDKEFPNRQKHPSLYYWYINIKQFSPDAISGWSIKSDKDEYFLDILNRYQKKQNSADQVQFAKSDVDDDDQCQDIQLSRQRTYCLNFRFKKLNKNQIQKLKKHIQRKAQILSCQSMGQQLVNITIKCDEVNLQLIKGEADKTKSIISYSVKKGKCGKLSRARTFGNQ